MKPDGYLNIPTGGERDFLRHLPIRKLPGVGPRTAEMLESLGVITIGRLAELPQDAILNVFGQSGFSMQRAACDISTSEVEPEWIPKSIGRETTFEQDLLDWDQIERILTCLTERAMRTLREEEMGTRPEERRRNPQQVRIRTSPLRQVWLSVALLAVSPMVYHASVAACLCGF